MASQTITADFTSTISVPDEADILVVKKGVTGTVATVAISAATSADDRQFVIDGHIEATARSCPVP